MQAKYDHEQLIDYIEGELPPEGMAKIDVMLAADAKLRPLIEAIKQDRAALRSLPPEAMPYPVVDNVLAGLERQMLLGDAPADVADDPIEAEARRHRMRIGPRLLRVASYAAIAAAFAVAGAVVIITLSDKGGLIDRTNSTLWTAEADKKDGGNPRLATTDLDKAGKIAGSKVRDESTHANVASKGVEPPRGQTLALAEPGQGSAASKAGRDWGEAGKAAGKAGVVSKTGAARERRVAVRETPPGAVRVNAARAVGNQGQFALSLPKPYEANVQIEVFSDNAEETKEALTHWLDLNDAQIVPADQALVGFGRGRQAPVSAEAKRDPARRSTAVRGIVESLDAALDMSGPPDVYCLVIEDEQVPQLMAYMNRSRDGRQSARLVESSQPQRVAMANVQQAYDDYSKQQQRGVEQAHQAPMPIQAASKESPAEQLIEPAPEAGDGDGLVAPLAKAPQRQQAEPNAAPLEPAADGDTPSQDSRLGRQDREAGAGQTERGTQSTLQARVNELMAGQKPTEPAESKADGQAKTEAQQKLARTSDDAGMNAAQPVPTQEPGTRQPSTDPTPALPAPVEADPRQVAEVEAETMAEAKEELLAEVNAFNWGAVLGSQLPLAPNTPLVLADRGRVVLPLMIRELPPGAKARLNEADLAAPEDADPTAAPNTPLDVE